MKKYNIIKKICKYYKKMKESPYNNIYREKTDYYIEELFRNNKQQISNLVPKYMIQLLFF